jgi:hypothetical protein
MTSPPEMRAAPTKQVNYKRDAIDVGRTGAPPALTPREKQP